MREVVCIDGDRRTKKRKQNETKLVVVDPSPPRKKRKQCFKMMDVYRPPPRQKKGAEEEDPEGPSCQIGPFWGSKQACNWRRRGHRQGPRGVEIKGDWERVQPLSSRGADPDRRHRGMLE